MIIKNIYISLNKYIYIANLNLHDKREAHSLRSLANNPRCALAHRGLIIIAIK